MLAGHGSETAFFFEGDRWDMSRDGGRGVTRQVTHQAALLTRGRERVAERVATVPLFSGFLTLISAAIAVAVATLALVDTALDGLTLFARKNAARAFGSDTFVDASSLAASSESSFTSRTTSVVVVVYRQR